MSQPDCASNAVSSPSPTAAPLTPSTNRSVHYAHFSVLLRRRGSPCPITRFCRPTLVRDVATPHEQELPVPTLRGPVRPQEHPRVLQPFQMAKSASRKPRDRLAAMIAALLGWCKVRTSEHPQVLAAARARSFIAVATPRRR